MEQPGLRGMAVGLVIAAIGLAITAWSYSAMEETGQLLVTYGAVLAGGLQFLRGLFRWTAYRLKSPDQRRQDHELQGFRSIVQAMVYTAAADRTLSTVKIARMRSITTRIFSAPVSEDQLRSLFKQEHKLSGSVGSLAREAPLDLRRSALRASIIVACAEGPPDDEAVRRLNRLERRLKLPKKSLDQMLLEVNTVSGNEGGA